MALPGAQLLLGAGAWILSATARTDSERTPAEALTALVAAVREIYG